MRPKDIAISNSDSHMAIKLILESAECVSLGRLQVKFLFTRPGLRFREEAQICSDAQDDFGTQPGTANMTTTSAYTQVPFEHYPDRESANDQVVLRGTEHIKAVELIKTQRWSDAYRDALATSHARSSLGACSTRNLEVSVG